MLCFNCNSELTNADTCPNCGVDVRKYKKIIYASNALYNDGLKKAKVRDLSGAENSLVQSIRLNKCNIAARNLLGLVRYETGEVASALSEWVISSNLQQTDNPALDYIKDVQSSGNRLSNMGQAIKKYNRALEYCYQGGFDLAVIQLKKVLQLNPKFLRARQLLALLYIQNKEYKRAEKELSKCAKIDSCNTTTLRFQQEVREQMLPESGIENEDNSNGQADGVVKYRDGNEVIIQPAGAVSPSVEEQGRKLPTMLLNMGIGFIVGAAIVGFFVLPAQIQKVRSSSTAELKAVAEQSDAKTATVSEQESKIEELTKENEELQTKIQSNTDAADRLASSDALSGAVNAYLTDPEDISAIADALVSVNPDASTEDTSEEYKELLSTFLDLVRPDLSEEYYNSGLKAYESGDYEEAITRLGLALTYGDQDADANYALAEYYLADSYYKQYQNAPQAEKSKYADSLKQAQQYFNKVQNSFAGTNAAADAAEKLKEISLEEDPSTGESTADDESEGGTIQQGTN